MLHYVCNYIWLLHVIVAVLAASNEDVSGSDAVSRDAAAPRACRRVLDTQDAKDQAFQDQGQKNAIFPHWFHAVKKASPDDRSVSASVVVPQQDQLKIVLKATYFYACGRTGTHSRRFTWEAVYTVHDGFHLIALQNVDGFFHVEPNVPEPGDFRAAFHAHWSVGYAEMCCRYLATGHIQGTLYEDMIGMNLVPMSGPEESRPHVSESCSVGRRTMVRVPHACTITYVHVEQG